MSRKKLLLLTLFLVALAAVVYLSNPFSTLSNADRSISLDHPEEVTSVILEEQGKILVLEKDAGGGWTVNGKYPASRNAVYDLLRWMQRINIQTPLSGDQGSLGEKGHGQPLRIQVYRKNRKIRDLTVLSGDTGDESFLVKHSRRNRWFLAGSFGKEKMASVLPGTEAADWREKMLFRLDPTAIRVVELRFVENAEASFRLEYSEGEGFILFNHQGMKAGVPDREKATRYFAYFMQIPLEKFLNPVEAQFADSLVPDDPLYILRVETLDTMEEYHFYPMPVSDGEGESGIDPYRLLGLHRGKDEYFRIRYLDIDPVLKDLNYFMN